MKRILFFLTLALLPILAGAQTLADTTRFKAFDLSKDFVYTGLQLKQFVRPYAVYVANVTQTGGVDPVAVVLENTTGATLTWTRLGPGQYRITSTGLFSTPSKLSLPGARIFVGGDDSDLLLGTSWIRIDNNTLEMRTTELKVGSLTQTEWNNTDDGFTVEIRIYP